MIARADQARRVILAAALTLLVGIALVATAHAEFGRFVVLVGFGALAAGIHVLGRTGPDGRAG